MKYGLRHLVSLQRISSLLGSGDGLLRSGKGVLGSVFLSRYS
jgi:hypothetical protein